LRKAVIPRGLQVPGTCICGVGAVTRKAMRAGAMRTRVEKFFVRITECWDKAHELNQLKNRKTRGCTKAAYQHCAWGNRPAATITLWCKNPSLRDVSSDTCCVVGKWPFPLSIATVPSYLVRN